MELPINTTHEAKTPIYTKDGHMDAKTNIIVLETTKHLKKKKKKISLVSTKRLRISSWQLFRKNYPFYF